MTNSTMETNTSTTVPTEVQRTLSAAGLSAATAPPDDDAPAAERAEWWQRAADANDQRAAAYERLYHWAIDTGQPAAVCTAIVAAVAHHMTDARRSRREMRRARRSATAHG